jgi:hypothetical protein
MEPGRAPTRARGFSEPDGNLGTVCTAAVLCVIDIRTETLFPLAELPAHWPLLPGGRRLHRSVGYRYATKGVGPRSDRLETVVMGSIRYTSHEAVQRFVERLTEAEDGVPVRAPTTAEKNRRRAAASRILDDAGIS